MSLDANVTSGPRIADGTELVSEACDGCARAAIMPNGEADIRPLQRAESALAGQVPVLGQGNLLFFSRLQLLRLLDETGYRMLRFRNISLRKGDTCPRHFSGMEAKARTNGSRSSHAGSTTTRGTFRV